MNRGLMNRQMFKMGGVAFPDLSGDGQVTQKDILMGRGVIEKQEGGMVPQAPMMMEEPMIAAPGPAMMPQDPMMMPQDPMMMPQEGQASPEGFTQIFEQMQGQMDTLEDSDDLEEMMNAVRGDVQPVEARRAELAEYVGPDDAQQTPDTVLALVQPVMQLAGIDQGIGSLAEEEMMETSVEGPMAEGIMSTVNMAPEMPAEAAMMEVGSQPPVNFNQGGAVQYFAPQNPRVAGLPPVSNIQKAFDERQDLYRGILGDSATEDQAMLDEQRKLSQSQMLFDVANTALAFATPGSRQMSPAERLAEAAQETQLFDKLGARSQSVQDLKDKQELARRSTAQAVDMAALGAAEKDVEGAQSIRAALARARAGRASKPMELVLADGTVEMIDGNNVDFKAINQAGATIRPLGTPEKGFVNLYDTKSNKIEMVEKTRVDTFTTENPEGNWVDIGTYKVDDDDTFTPSQAAFLVTNQDVLNKYGDGTLDPTLKNRFEAALIDQIRIKFTTDAQGNQIEVPGQALIKSQEEAIRVANERDPDSVSLQLKQYVNPTLNQVIPLSPADLEELLEEQRTGNAARGFDSDATTLNFTTLESPAFKQSLTDVSGFINPEAPGWKYIPTLTINDTRRQIAATPEGEPTLDISVAQGLSSIKGKVQLFFVEPAADIFGLKVPKAARDLTIADVALRNIRLLAGRFMTARLPDRDSNRMLAAEYDRLEENLEGLEPGLFRFDTTGLAALNGVIDLVASDMSVIIKAVPEWGSSRTDPSASRLAERRGALDQGTLLMAEMLALRDNLEMFTEAGQAEGATPMEDEVGKFSWRNTVTKVEDNPPPSNEKKNLSLLENRQSNYPTALKGQIKFLGEEIFGDDANAIKFMERLIQQESRMGQDPGTYSLSGKLGKRGSYGVAQVDEPAFDQVQKKLNDPNSTIYKYIKPFEEAIGVDLRNIRYEDLKEDILSVAIGRLYLMQHTEDPIPTEIEDQGRYWKTNYNTYAGKGTGKEFVLNNTSDK